MDTVSKNILIFMATILLFYLLSALSGLILPLIFAILFAILFQPLIAYLHKIKFPRWLNLPVVTILTLLVIIGLANIFISTINEIAAQKIYLLSRLNLRLDDGIKALNSLTGKQFSSEIFQKWFIELYQKGWLGQALGNLASGVSSFTGSFVMFALYYIFLLSGLSNYKKYLKYVAGDDTSGRFVTNIEKIQKSVNSYIITKTMTSIGTAICITVICLAFGVKFPFFFGLLTFILNYIPTFGSIFAVVLPLLMGVIQFDNFQEILFLFLALEATQFIIGNFIEPKILGNSLRLNTVTVLFGLVLWGYIWGIAGMMLSVPLMVIIKLILEYSPSLSIVARIMGYPEKQV